MAMSVTYNIDCQHCGSHSEYATWLDSSSARHGVDELVRNIDTECAIRCPVCRAKLNSSADAFRRQVTITAIK